MAKRTSLASAPTKAILFGEHFVVYGAPGLAMPIDPRNWAEVRVADGRIGLEVHGDVGTVFAKPDGSVEGTDSLKMFGAPYWFLLTKGVGCGVGFEAKLRLERPCKGIGNSSSLGAALSVALAGVAGCAMGRMEAFECAQLVDEIAHGGKPSGIDAKTVVEGKPQKFRRVFSPPSYEFHSVGLELPGGFGFLVIDTSKGKKSTTSELIARFGKAVGARGAPNDLTEEERREIYSQYLSIYNQAIGCIKMKNTEGMRRLGGLMNKNHELLSERGVSTKDIESVRNVCLENGALGIKISGAGGEGGAVLALVERKQLGRIKRPIKDLGFGCFEVNIADRGVVLEK